MRPRTTDDENSARLPLRTYLWFDIYKSKTDADLEMNETRPIFLPEEARTLEEYTAVSGLSDKLDHLFCRDFHRLLPYELRKHVGNPLQQFPRFTYGVYKQNPKLVFIQNCQTKVYCGFYASLRYIERKSAIEGTKPREGYQYLPFTVTVYLFLAKKRCLNSKLPNKGIPWIFCRLRYVERK